MLTHLFSNSLHRFKIASTTKCAVSFLETVHFPSSCSDTRYGATLAFLSGFSARHSPSVNNAGRITRTLFSDPASGRPGRSVQFGPMILSSGSPSSLVFHAQPAQCEISLSAPTLSLCGTARRYPYKGLRGRGRAA